jgi:hypothetical protein
VSVVHLSQADMERFRNRNPRDPSVRHDEILRAYAEETGGLTLEFWKLSMGRIWDEPYMMTAEDVAERLNRPVAELQNIVDETNIACGWRPKMSTEGEQRRL